MFERTPNLVSVVVPIYNNVRYLPECLSSLVNQTYKNIEIILVDDCSTDHCRDFIDDWREQVSDVLSPDRIIYIQLPRNVKQPGSATVGLYLSRGEFIACQAADDLSHPQRLEKQLSYLEQHPEVDMVGTNYASFHDGDFEHRTLEYSGWIVYGREQIRQSYALGRHCVCDGTIVMRGPLFDRIGGWTRRLKGVSDFEFVGRYVSSGAITENLQEVLYFYRLHPEQTTNRIARGEEW